MAKDRTEELLNNISKRLSGRDDCRNMNYCIVINHGGVEMSPSVFVYPDIHHRKDKDKVEIVEFVKYTMMKDAKLSDFTFGTYLYESNYERTKRRWVRVD